ncbi:MAG: putative Rossmann fold flavoprotein, partial [Planctomycetota bacterium]
TGTKILASGGTRCNLTTTLGPIDAARLFCGSGARFLRSAFRALPPERVRERFAELGVPTSEAPLEKIFPTSGRARDVRDALEREALEAGAQIELNASIHGLRQLPSGAFDLALADGLTRTSPCVMLCTGGKSYPSTGTTGEGYEWLRSLGLKVLDTAPALVPLASPAPWVHSLTGIAWQGGEARLRRAGGKIIARRRRPLLFTHQGLSGPAALDLSVHVARAEAGADFVLSLDFFPDHDWDALRDLLIEAASWKGQHRLSRVLPASAEGEPMPRRLLAAVTEAAGLDASDLHVDTLNKARRHQLVETLKGLEVPIRGTLDFDRAEVTTGGLDLKAVNPRSMEVRSIPGLYVFGELLDLDGPIGGLNFQAAFACAQLAALAATPELSE